MSSATTEAVLSGAAAGRLMVTELLAAVNCERLAAVEQESADGLVGESGDDELPVRGPVIDEEVEAGLAGGGFPRRSSKGQAACCRKPVTALAAASFFCVQRPQASFSNGLAWVP